MMNLLEEAIVYSTIMYQGKVRKIKNTPFILHPLEVAQILSTMTDDFEIIAAGVLHDVVEDTDGTLGEIRKRFGERVAMLVDSETESEFPDESKADSWFKRKEYALEKLRNSTDIGVKMLWLADKLSNLRSLARSYGEVGEKLWENLHQKDPAMQLRYYKAIAEHTEMDLNKTGVYKEYIDRINYIWPGTFDSSKAKYKKYREVSVDHCERIGKGAKSDVYRYDDELIIKVYNSKNTYKDVEQEIGMTRTAFVMGLPTAISFGIVAVGSRYGAMFELIDAKTISELIAKNPEHIEYYAGVMADLALQIHGTEQEDEALFPARIDPYRHAPGHLDHFRVADPAGSGQQHLVTGIDYGLQRAQDHLLRAVADDDLLSGIIEALFLQQVFGDGGAQARHAAGSGISRLALVDRPLARLADMLRGNKIRLTDAQGNDILAAVAHLADQGVHLQGCGRRDRLAGSGEGQGHRKRLLKRFTHFLFAKNSFSPSNL